MASMASIMADIGDRSAPTADGAGRRPGPSRICIGISSAPPSPRIPHAGARRPQHGPAMGRAAEISAPLPPVPRKPWVLEGSGTRRGWELLVARGERLVRYERFRWFFACSDLEFGWRTL